MGVGEDFRVHLTIQLISTTTHYFLKIISSLLDAPLHLWLCKTLQQHPCHPATPSVLLCPVPRVRRMHRSEKAQTQLTLQAAGSSQSYTTL